MSLKTQRVTVDGAKKRRTVEKLRLINRLFSCYLSYFFSMPLAFLQDAAKLVGSTERLPTRKKLLVLQYVLCTLRSLFYIHTAPSKMGSNINGQNLLSNVRGIIVVFSSSSMIVALLSQRAVATC